MTALALNLPWNDQGTSFRMDVFSLVLALAIHAPLYFMTFDTTKKSLDVQRKERLVSVDLIDKLPEKKKVLPPPPPPKKKNLASKIKALFRKKAPPPPPKSKVKPKKLATGPKKIKLEPKLRLAKKNLKKLKSREGFKTKADPRLVKAHSIKLKKLPVGISAPLTAKKVGVLKDKGKLKSNKGNFRVASTSKLRSIGGSGPSISGVAAPSISIRTAKKGSVEKFTKAAKRDKGSLGNVNVSGLGKNKALSFRDRIIARDAGPSRIQVASRSGRTGGRRGGVVGGTPGGTGTKKDLGSFQGGRVGGVVGGVPGGVVGGVGVARGKPKIAPVKRKRKKKSMFTITGPLRDRKIIKQVLPEYPAWAQAKGIEASVVLEFTVNPKGTVKDAVVVRRTSGYSKLDRSAIRALKKWRFKALPLDENRNEVGLITFNYTLI